jgi:CheY-like chemotaxis protein
MTDKVKARLFEPFFSTKPLGEGTGLGLATCHGIVTQNGGHIWVDSEPGLGTTFRIYLPRAGQAAEPPSEREESDLAPTGTETLLLVEDEESARALIARGLRGLGYTVLEAANGAEALRVAPEPSDEKIDLLVTDVVMPRMSGKELADRLTARHPETRVLFISGYPDDVIARRGVLDAGIALLQKPFSSAELARRMRQLLDA